MALLDRLLHPFAGRSQENPALDVLRRVFGYPAFRGLQEDAIAHVIEGGDALVLMPTGGGKSLCYQVPALCRDGMAIVVSPLIALMDDQVAALRQLGINAAALHSELEADQGRAVFRAAMDARLDLLYVSPERLLNGLMDRLPESRIALIAIDEAHCVSQWGHEFRPEYRALARLPERFPGVPRIALTATADARTRDDILRALGMEHARVYAASFHRPNLRIAAAEKIAETSQMMGFLARHRHQAGIIYCGSRAKTERAAQRLREKGIDAIAYHAGLPPAEKQAALARFRGGEPVVMVATIAFGMGIDRPDVRFVVHLDMPDSPESYYQQIGRAGRDGEESETLLLYGGEDIARARHFLSVSVAPDSQKRVMRQRLDAMIGLAEAADCRTRALLSCFGEIMEQPCGHCDLCAAPPETFDGTVEAQKVLSAVYRTSQPRPGDTRPGMAFGALHIVALLRGELTEGIQRHQHDRLPTYGVGQDRPATFWRSVIRQLIARGMLDMDVEGHGGLQLVPDRARTVLRGTEKVFLRQETASRLPTRRTREERRANNPVSDNIPDAIRAEFDALRAWRMKEAKEQGVPPYVIFHDSVLRDIATSAPTDLETLGRIKGVGASKLDRYGRHVLAVLAGV
ncbi:ATP-dependent DNA helicase recQ [Granulibacter bethesdensis]|uniref:DNA helicase RecQ n=1 Tax=Granulibacter bethesdensis TaxID=364410 RepID=A0AAC9K9M8_9PROT|nr:ATP-dependent DNA helicase recQ [Granulibacter bethesdensis]APH61716.1 ATP-dependent DNA helicase recQ [Granulibacter bethesdensis]